MKPICKARTTTLKHTYPPLFLDTTGQIERYTRLRADASCGHVLFTRLFHIRLVPEALLPELVIVE